MHQDPWRPLQLDLGEEELSRASGSLIAYVVEGRDPGTLCGIPHISQSCPCTLRVESE
jgi:hypothetical protein